MVFIPDSLAIDPPTSERTSWLRIWPSYQRLSFRQASFTLSQEGTRSISFLGRLRNPTCRLPGIYPFQKGSQWYLRIPKTQVQQWTCVDDLEKQYTGES
jgi:hypothetical protein